MVKNDLRFALYNYYYLNSPWIQLPNANNDLLILAPSTALYPFDFFFSSWVVLSEPAKSAIDNFE
jgi:hypothetical protein